MPKTYDPAIAERHMVRLSGPLATMKWTFSAVALLALVAPTPALAANTCKARRLKQGMAYAVARKAILSLHFQAPTLPAYGYEPDDQKVTSERFGSLELCNKYPEIKACSGQGHCNMAFSDAYGNVLTVSTYGDISDGTAAIARFEIMCQRNDLLTQPKARTLAISILKGDPYGDNAAEVTQIIKGEILIVSGKREGACDVEFRQSPAWVFRVQVPKTTIREEINGELLLNAKTGKLICTTLPFIN